MGKRLVSPERKREPPKVYDKEYQKIMAPTFELDPLYLYYTSLYSQKPKSPLAITWLTIHGVFDGNKRDKLVKQYEELKSSDKLIKLK
jgi:hypothetical protein